MRPTRTVRLLRAALLLALLGSAALLGAGCSPSAAPAPVYTLSPSEDAAAPAAAQVAQKAGVYVVQRGDTLIAIAMQHDVDPKELARWNNLRNPNLIEVGQRLALVRPANDPVATSVVPRRGTSGLQPAGTASRAEPASASTSAVRRETTLIGGAQQNAAPAAATAPGVTPFKEGPKATQYAYSPQLLKKLRQEWQAQQSAAPKSAAAAAPAVQTAPAPAAQPATPAKPVAAKSDAPGKTRQKYGVTWGLPVRGAVLKNFSAQSKGIAFGGARGNPIYAAADGEVIYVGTGVKSYGRLVILRHKNDYLTAYAHNDEILVKEGQRVARGSIIGKMGDSGSERVMLHFEVRRGGKPVNPAQVLPQ